MLFSCSILCPNKNEQIIYGWPLTSANVCFCNFTACIVVFFRLAGRSFSRELFTSNTGKYYGRLHDCHPGVCNKLMTVYVARHPLMIGSSLSLTLSSVKHILQDVNRKAQNHT